MHRVTPIAPACICMTYPLAKVSSLMQTLRVSRLSQVVILGLPLAVKIRGSLVG